MDSELNFLLINPTAPEWRIVPGSKPSPRARIFRFSMLTSLAVAASLPDNVKVRILDEEVEALDFGAQADLIGISFMTFNAPRAYEIADIFRNQKGKTVIMGGYHPTFMPEEALRHCDSVCIGEAEPNLPQMVQDFRQGCLKRIYDKGPADLALLKIPNRKLISGTSYIWAQAIQATRGCNNHCTYCSITSFFNHKFRARPVDQVIAELKTLGRNILFLDDNITTDKDYAHELFTRMIPLNKRWFSQCSITIADNATLLDLAMRSGCKGLFIGFESLSQQNLHEWKKDFNRTQDYAKAIARLHRHGISIQAAIVLGHDWDTPQAFSNTLDFLLENNIDALQCTILTPFPGTPLFEQMDQAGRILERNWSKYDFKHVVFQPRQMSRSTLQSGLEWVLTNFYSRRNILRRVLKGAGYLDPYIVVTASLPLNLSYRYRLQTNGVWKTQTGGSRIDTTIACV